MRSLNHDNFAVCNVFEAILGDFIPMDVLHGVSAVDVPDPVSEAPEFIGIASCPDFFVLVMLYELAIF